MSNGALRLLQLQKEFNDREDFAGLDAQHPGLGVAPRPAEAIAADYAAALSELLAKV